MEDEDDVEEPPPEPCLTLPPAATWAAVLLARNAKVHARRGLPGPAAVPRGCRSALCLQVCFPIVVALLVTLLPCVLIEALVPDSESIFEEEVTPPTFHGPWPGLALRMDGDGRRSSEEVRLSPNFARYKRPGQSPMLGLNAVEGSHRLHDLLFARTRLPWQCYCKTLAIAGHQGSAEAFRQYAQRQHALWEAAAQSQGFWDPVNSTAKYLLDMKVKEGESAWLGCNVNAGHEGPIFRLFSSGSDVDAWINDPSYGNYARDRTEQSQIDRLCGAIIFENDVMADPEPRYTIRTNITTSGKKFGYQGSSSSRYADLADLSQFLTRPGADFMPDERRDDAGALMWYQYSGFLSLQHLTHGFLAERGGSTSMKDILLGEPRFVPMPLGEARFRPYYEALTSFVTHPLLLVLQFSPGVAMLAYYLCQERWRHRREFMESMGCSKTALTLSWQVLFLFINLGIALPCAVLLQQTCVWRSSPSVLLLAYYLFACGINIMGVTAAVLAPTERMGAVAALGFVLFSSFASMSPFDTLSSKLFASLLPTSAFQMIVDAVLALEASGSGCTWATVSRRVGNFSVAWGLGMLALDIPLWLFLYHCLDYFTPWGSRAGSRERLRCRGFGWRGRSPRRPPAGAEEGGSDARPGLFEPEEEMVQKDLCVIVSGLAKEFEGLGGAKVRSVDSISMRMYDAECFCLLGHNGAGKTTTLSLLIGILTPTRGSIRVCGSKLPQDLQRVRASIGFCPQQTILFDELKVSEHLALLGRRRPGPAGSGAAGRAGGEGLVDSHMGQSAASLSSSMRRKLSIAMAFQGGPKLVVLDEPSGGMDPTSRCGLWRTLQSRRRNCILCISTHSIMEAEALGDRIAIMSQGRLACCGSHRFLTRSCRCGYVLGFSRRGALPDEALLELVREHCGPLACIASAMGRELRIQVPFEEASSLPKLFSIVDKRRDFLGIETYSVTMTSFEELFSTFGHSAGAMEQALQRTLGRPDSLLLKSEQRRPSLQSQASWVPPLQTELTTRTDSPSWQINIVGDTGETPRAETPQGSPLGSWTPRTSRSPPTPRSEPGQAFAAGRAPRTPRTPGEAGAERAQGGHARAPWTPRSNLAAPAFTPGRAPRTPREGETPRSGRGLLSPGGPREESVRGGFTPGRAPRTPRESCGEGTPASRGKLPWTPRGGTPRTGTPREGAQKAIDGGSSTEIGQRKVRKAKSAGFLFQLLSLSKRRVKCGTRDPKMLFVRLFLPSLCPVVYACLASHRDAALPPKALDVSSWNVDVQGSRVPLTIAVEEATAVDVGNAALEAWINWAPPGVDKVHFRSALNASDANFTSLDPEIFGLASDQVPQLRAEKAFVDLFLSRQRSLAASQYGAVLYPRERYVRASRHSPGQQGLNHSWTRGACSVLDEQGESSILKECVAAVRADAAGPTIFANLSAYHAAPTLFNIHASALLRAHTRGALQRVEVVNHPFQRTAHKASAGSGRDGLILAVTLLCVWSLIPASIVSYTVMERERGVKCQLLMSGSGQTAYWLSNFIFDCFLCLTAMGTTLIVVEVCRQDAVGLLDMTGIQGLVVLLTVYGFAATASSYLLASVFSKSDTAALVTLVGNIVIGCSGSAAISALQSAGGDMNNVAEVLAPMLRFLPPCALGLGAVQIGRGHRLAGHLGVSALSGRWTGGMSCLTASAPSWECTYLVGDEVLMLGLEAFLCLALTVALGCASELPAWRRHCARGARRLPLACAEDADVAAENQRVAGMNSATEIICVNGVSKVYHGGAHAVRGISFGATEGEVFGVLGPNGAGKTTLLRVITGELLPSTGRIHVRGLDVVSCISDVRRLFGYCPQRDPLLDGLTAREHLELHGRLRGASGQQLTVEVQHQLARLGLSACAHWRAGQLSSGNRRRLSVALACAAEPPLVFLDEPSAGMDPAARRELWAVVQGMAQLRRRSVVLLATHSPDEAESLCSRVAIQADGVFRRLGSTQRLRSYHSQGMELCVHLVPPTTEDIDLYFQGDQELDDAARVSAEALLFRARREQLEAFLARELGREAPDGRKRFRLQEAAGTFLRYEIVQTAADGDPKPFGEIFKLLEASREDLELVDLHLSHGSLVQAFNAATQADGKLQVESLSSDGAPAASEAGRGEAAPCGLGRVTSDSAFTDSEMGEMTTELDTVKSYL